MLGKLDEIISQIPYIDIGGKKYKPIFRYGTKGQLAEDLSLQRKTGEKYYPLIYLETPFSQDAIVTLRFILATLNIRTDMRNKDRLDLTFNQVLLPLKNNLYHALLRSGVFYRTPNTPYGTYNGEFVFNYHMTPDIWDALIYQVELRFKDDCDVKKIYFKN